MSGQILNDFVEQTNRLYLENMKRVRDDVEWFINKFDHKYADEPWKNAKDSLTRAMIKTASVLPEPIQLRIHGYELCHTCHRTCTVKCSCIQYGW